MIMFEIITAKKPQEANEIAAIVKQTSLVLATVLLASLLTACGGGSSSSDNNNSGGTTQVDTDNDGIADVSDTDDDNDGVLDSEDAFPLNAAESKDTDGDSTGDNADTDDDNDGVADSSDAFPLDAAESIDTDSDGTGNNADTDDDGDGILDTEDSDPLNPPAATGFTKLDAAGKALSADSASWSCVKDNVTGLLWEAKTDDGGLQDKDWKYFVGENNTSGNCGESLESCNTVNYVAAVNAKSLCGKTNWRLPTFDGVHGYSDAGIPNYGEFSAIYDAAHNPAVVLPYFSDTVKFDTNPEAYDEGYCTSIGTMGVNFVSSGWAWTAAGNNCRIRLVSGTAK
jgi:hypothetical protein